MKLKGEIISEAEIAFGIDGVEINIEEFELDHVELEKKFVKNIREDVAMLLEITDKETLYSYDFPPRPKFETSGGYKTATRKGARLHEVKVFNLYFRFLNQKIDARSIAMMYRPPNKFEEWVFLLPDNTQRRIEQERREFINDANYYTIRQLMNPDHQSFLIENLNKLIVNERCAQSLMHEFGHVLHWRMFDALNIQNSEDVYIWFYENKYVHNVDKRFPNFISLTNQDKIIKLKESLVEDYRISLNREAENGMFILPNRISYQGDFIRPELLEEGVFIMKKMLQPALENRAHYGKYGFSSEIDTIQAIREARTRARQCKWTPGTPSMTEPDHLEVIHQLRNESTRLKLLPH